jgi:hypothetical protein
MLPPPPPPKSSALRPGFVVALMLVALPILLLFGLGLVTDNEIEASTRLIMAPIYVLGVLVAPPVLWRLLVRRGARPSSALAAAVGFAMGSLALDLTVLTRSALLFLLIAPALALGTLAWSGTSRKNTPANPGPS